MKTTKIFYLAVTTLLLSLFTTGCVPTGGGPTPTNTFNVNIEFFNLLPSSSPSEASLFIDGDSIKFKLIHPYIPFGYPPSILIISSSTPSFEILNVKKRYYNGYSNTYDSIKPPSDVNTLNSGILINNTYTANTWESFSTSPDYGYSSFSYLYDEIWNSPLLTNGISLNTDEYIVLRKLIGVNYQYYWIRVRREELIPNNNFGGIFKIKILNGKYQMNSITTGQ